MGEQQSLDFGTDINATPLSNLQMPATMTSRNDPGAPPPVTPPVYVPNVDLPDKRVRFDDEVRYSEPKKKKHRRYEPPPVTVEKKKKLFKFLQDYRRQIIVFLLTLAFAWYYPSLVRVQYIGNSQNLTLLGMVAIPLAIALLFSGAEYILE